MIRPAFLPCVLLALVSFAWACASSPAPRVVLDAPWPQKASDLDAAHARWTRRATYSDDWTLVIDAAATLQTPDWRAAYVRERARRQHLGAEAEAELAAKQRAAADSAWEVELVVAIARPDWNDLKKGKDSMWRLALVGDDGREVTPTEIRQDRRPRAEVAAYFPQLKAFYNAYVVTFPKATPDGRPVVAPGARSVTLKIGSTLGAVELVWLASAAN